MPDQTISILSSDAPSLKTEETISTPTDAHSLHKHTGDCACDLCRQRFQHLMWTWMTDAYGAVADLERLANRVTNR